MPRVLLFLKSSRNNWEELYLRALRPRTSLSVGARKSSNKTCENVLSSISFPFKARRINFLITRNNYLISFSIFLDIKKKKMIISIFRVLPNFNLLEQRPSSKTYLHNNSLVYTGANFIK